MRHFLFASHGNLARGMLDTVEIITGKHENIWTISAYKQEHDDLSKQLDYVIKQLTPNDELIIITDIFGGSVNNECMKLLEDKRIHLLAGLNLPLIIELISMQNIKQDTEIIIQKALNNAKDSILYCNNLLSSKPEDDDF